MDTSLLYSTKLVIRISGATANQLKYWVKVGLVAPEKAGKKYFYTFRNIIRIKIICNLKDRGLSLQRIRKGIDNLNSVLPIEDEPLTRLVILTDGKEIIAIEKGMYFSATSLQKYFRFDMEELKTEILSCQSQKESPEKEQTNLTSRAASNQ